MCSHWVGIVDLMEQELHTADGLTQAHHHLEPRYCLVLSIEHRERAEQQVRKLIEAKRGQLIRLERTLPHKPTRLHAHLGARRIDDVITALEGAGFDVNAVVATREPPDSRYLARSTFSY